MTSKYGMDGEGKERNFVYLNTVENPMLSEKVVNDLNEEVKQVCNEAYKRAEEVIHGNKGLIEALVKAIMKRHIMSETELDAICHDYFENIT